MICVVNTSVHDFRNHWNSIVVFNPKPLFNWFAFFLVVTVEWFVFIFLLKFNLFALVLVVNVIVT